MDKAYQLREGHMLRDEWEFEYTAAKLAEAAKEQRDFRKSRVEVWEAKKIEVVDKIKSSGLSVHEGPAASMASYTNSSRGGAHVLVDTTLQSDLNECVDKIKTHREAATDYDGWYQVLWANPESRLKLTHNDWLYFFGRG